MANISGILALVHGMRVYLATYSPGTVVTAAGWKQRPQQINQGQGQANRIVLYPGFEPGGKAAAAGTLTRDKRPSTTNPRALLTWLRPITMSVWAVDTTDTYNEELQIAASDNLIELAVQAVHNAVDPDTQRFAGLAAIEWGAVRYTNPPSEQGFGLEVLIEFVQKTPVFDQTQTLAFPQPVVTQNMSTKPLGVFPAAPNPQ